MISPGATEERRGAGDSVKDSNRSLNAGEVTSMVVMYSCPVEDHENVLGSFSPLVRL